MSNFNLEEQFDYIAEQMQNKGAVVLGGVLIDEDGTPHPQIGVAGRAWDTIVLIASLVSNIADHVDDTEENILGIIYEMIVGARNQKREKKEASPSILDATGEEKKS